MAAPLGADGQAVRTRVAMHGEPAVAIPDTARRLGCDPIALGRHGQGGFSRLPAGGVAAGGRMARRAGFRTSRERSV